MKLKEGFVLREIAGQIVVLPTGDDLNLSMMITLNETAKFLWERLVIGADHGELVSALQDEYSIDESLAVSAVDGFVAKLNQHGFLEK